MIKTLSKYKKCSTPPLGGTTEPLAPRKVRHLLRILTNRKIHPHDMSNYAKTTLSQWESHWCSMINIAFKHRFNQSSRVLLYEAFLSLASGNKPVNSRKAPLCGSNYTIQLVTFFSTSQSSIWIPTLEATQNPPANQGRGT